MIVPKLKILFLFIFLACSQSSFSQKQSTGRIIISLDKGWDFNKQDSAPVKVDLPHSWNTQDVLDDTPGYYRDIAWYIRKLDVKPEWKGKAIWLAFEGANQETEVFVNGKKAGEHIGGYTGFNIEIGNLLQYDKGANEIKVKLNNRFNADIPPLTADFTFFGGLYRSVNLVVTGPVHFEDKLYSGPGVYISTPQVSAALAKIEIKGSLNTGSTKGQLSVITEVYDASGKQVKKLSSSVQATGQDKLSFRHSAELAQPHLWSPEDPYLYRLVTYVQEGKKILDRVTHRYGFRWFSFDANKGFFLNGNPYKLIGASRHQDYAGMANALPDSLHLRDVRLLKEMGGNFLRVAHYPQDPAVMQACDSLGLLTSVEIPIVNTITESEAFAANSKQMLLEMIRQNYNHASVIIWCYMNEVLLRPKYGDDKERQQVYFKKIQDLAQSLEDITRREDPLRYTMMANHGDFNGYTRTGLTGIPQLVGWNLYQGWYGANIKGFADFLDQHHKTLPDKPLLVTEYGADFDPRIRSANPERFDKSGEYAIFYHQVYLQEMLKRPFVSAAMVWNLADFNSETREESMPHINNKGLLSIDRKAKDTYYLYQAYLLKRPYIRIGSRNWTRRAGNENNIYKLQVYSNQPAAELFLNGKSLGQKEVINHSAEWEVAFVNGANQLRAVGKGATDEAEINYSLIPSALSKNVPFNTLNILLGARRGYIDNRTGVYWLPDQAYVSGAWGHVGGEPFKLKNTSRQSYGTDKNILGTEHDPVYQTQQTGISQYKLDVPDGEYELTLHFAELTGGTEKETLAYNLDNSNTNVQAQERVFDVQANGTAIITGLNIAREYGYTTAGSKTFKIKAENGKGIQLDFKKVTGQPVLNALQVKKTE